jgi:hypothetical protein
VAITISDAHRESRARAHDDVVAYRPIARGATGIQVSSRRFSRRGGLSPVFVARFVLASGRNSPDSAMQNRNGVKHGSHDFDNPVIAEVADRHYG